MTLSPKAKAHRDAEADKRSKRQCSTGQSALDKAISWYLKIGYEDGFNEAYEFARKEIFEATHPLIKDAKLYHEKSLSGWIELESRITTKPQPEGE